MKIIYSLIFLILFSHITIAQDYPLEIVIQKGHNFTPTNYEFSHDGKLLATAADKIVLIWDVATQRQLRTISFGTGVSTISFVPNSQHIVLGGYSSKPSIFNYVTGEKVADLPALNDYVQVTAVSKSGKYLAAGIMYRELDNNVAIYDLETRQIVRTHGKVKTIKVVEFDPTEKFFVYGGNDRFAYLVNIETGEEKQLECISETSQHSGIDGITFNADGKYLIADGGTEIEGNRWVSYGIIWNTADGSKVKTFAKDTESGSIDKISMHALPDPDRFLLGKYEWSISQAKNMGQMLKIEGAIPWSAMSKNGKYIATMVLQTEGVSIFDLSTSELLGKLEGHSRSARSVEISPDARYLGAKMGGGIHVWDIKSARHTQTIDNIYWLSGNFQFSPESDVIYAGSIDHKQYLTAREIKTGRELWTNEKVERPEKSKIHIIDDQYIYSVDGDNRGHIRKWDRGTGDLVKSYGRHDHYNSADCDENCEGFIHQINLLQKTDQPDVFNAYAYDTAVVVDLNLKTEKTLEGWKGKKISQHLIFSKDNIHAYALNQRLPAKYKVADWSQVTEYWTSNWPDTFHDMELTADENYIIHSRNNNSAQVWNTSSRTLLHTLQHYEDVPSLAVHPNSKYVYTASEDATVVQWDLASGKKIATYVGIDKTDHVILTPEGYYTASKGAAVGISFVKGLEVFDFGNFDLIFNRPDIVLQRIGGQNQKLIDSYKRAYLKRLKKMGFTERQISTEMHLPEMQILTEDFPVETDAETLTVQIKASDSKYNLDRVNIYVNSVPILGVKGKSIKEQTVSEYTETFEIPLSSGQNTIQFSTHNQNGMESLKKMVSIFCNVKRPVNTYVVSIGISDYQNDEFDLNYAAKDANDIAAKFGTDASKVFSVTDGNAVKEKILAIKEQLMNSMVDDRVVLFVAGHGLLDDNLDYFIGMHDVDFENPAARGLPYEDLEGLLDGIPARKKLMFIDACHSGEVDKDDSELVASNAVPEGTISARGFKTIASKSESLGLENSFQLMQELFADLRKGTGAVVISSASGAEFALESDAWQNGVFTYSILEGLEGRKCDTDKDGAVQVSELKDYVFDRVAELTNGKQHPTSRRENLEHDFVVW